MYMLATTSCRRRSNFDLTKRVYNLLCGMFLAPSIECLGIAFEN
jgi:hypothetical protein